MVKEGVDFVVHDAKSGEDLTRSVLTQIIFEQETKGENLLPVGFLRQLIGYYDDGLRALVPSYLEVAMENFADNQKQMRRNLESAFGDLLPVKAMQEVGEQNMAVFRQALSMFDPFARGETTNGQAPQARDPAPAASDDLDELRTPARADAGNSSTRSVAAGSGKARRWRQRRRSRPSVTGPFR